MVGIYRLLSRFDKVAFINNSAARAADYAAWLNIAQDRIHVVLNGVEPPDKSSPREIIGWRTALGLLPEAPVIGSVFRFSPEKDPLLWLETAARVAAERPDVVFVLVGNGPMREQMEQYAAALGISDRLFMPGVTRDRHIPVAAMDAFLLTSRLEGTPNVVIEAQSLGRPVVTTAAGGSAETIDRGKTGWVVYERSRQALAERLLATLADDEWLESDVSFVG